MAGLSREIRDLLPELVGAAEVIPGLKQLVLYGSFARGEEDRRSDVDLLLVVDTAEDPEKTEVAEKARRVVAEAFSRAGSERGVQIALTNLQGMDESFIENVAREGVVLWGKPFFLGPEGVLRPMTLFEYRVGGSSSVAKVRFYRALKTFDSYRVKNGLLVPEERAGDAESIFRINDIGYKKSKVWLA